MKTLGRLVPLSLATAATAGLIWASNFRLALDGSSDAVVRLAWSARPERVEQCRQQSQDALAALPQHMRQEFICEGVPATYRLEVRHADRLMVEQLVQGGGVRHDRPVYVFREIRLPAGEIDIDVRFVRVDPDAASGALRTDDDDGGDSAVGEDGSQRRESVRRRLEAEEADRRRGAAIPAALTLRKRVTLGPREVMLITYDPGRRALVAVERESP